MHSFVEIQGHVHIVPSVCYFSARGRSTSQYNASTLFSEHGVKHQADAMLSIAEVQKRAAGALQDGRDIMIQSQTGSGKTLAFLLPLLSALQYPPDLYPEDLKVQSNQHV